MKELKQQDVPSAKACIIHLAYHRGSWNITLARCVEMFLFFQIRLITKENIKKKKNC